MESQTLSICGEYVNKWTVSGFSSSFFVVFFFRNHLITTATEHRVYFVFTFSFSLALSSTRSQNKQNHIFQCKPKVMWIDTKKDIQSIKMDDKNNNIDCQLIQNWLEYRKIHWMTGIRFKNSHGHRKKKTEITIIIVCLSVFFFVFSSFWEITKDFRSFEWSFEWICLARSGHLFR